MGVLERFVRFNRSATSIQRRFSLLFSLAFFLFSAFFIAGFAWFKYDNEGNRKLERFDAFVTAQSNVLADSLWHLDHDRLDVILKAIVAEQDIVDAMVVDEFGATLAYAGERQTPGSSDLISVVRDIVISSVPGDKPAIIGKLNVSYTNAELIDELRRSAVLEMGFAAVLLLGGLGIAGFVNRHIIVTPIRNLAAAVNNPRRGDERVRVDWQAKDEIGTLIEAFNKMQEIEQQGEARLTEARDRLEERVRERTAELARAVDEAEKANRAKSEFLASMSHELRTPLNAISGISEMLMLVDSLRSDQNKLIEYLGDIRFSSQHLNSLVDDVLDLAKIEAGHVELDPEVFLIAPVASDVVKSLMVSAEQQSTTVETEFGDTALAVFADKRAFRQILLNLVNNAIRHGGSNLRVTLSAHLTAEGNEVCFTVEDNGQGMPQEMIGVVGQPFIHSHTPYIRSAAADDTQGTGLGLSIVTELLKASDGTLQVSSVEGEWTRVSFTLPVTAGTTGRQSH
ncbi:MAG: ATP-binding protein [Rhodospirillales bacterium]